MRGIIIENSVWNITFKDGFILEFVDASRKEIENYLGKTSTYDKHGYILKIERIK